MMGVGSIEFARVARVVLRAVLWDREGVVAGLRDDALVERARECCSS